MLDRIDEITGAGVTGDGPAVRLAAWFHDGVYDGERGDEDRSAVWAEEVLADSGHAAQVARLVRLTEHHDPAADDLPGQVLCDADLGILAAPPARYDAYLTGVRRDYAHVSEPTSQPAGRPCSATWRAAPGCSTRRTPASTGSLSPAPTWPGSWSPHRPGAVSLPPSAR